MLPNAAKVGPEGFEHQRISREKQGKGPRRVTAQSQNRLVLLVDGEQIALSEDQAAAIGQALGLPECQTAVS